jgi:predicted enzyme related to lactoylglutathione lyase
MPNPFVHIELNTDDPAKAKKFYGALFDWKLTDMPMPDGATYTMVEVGEGTGGGLFKNPMPGVPSFWLAYVSVPDVAAATAKAEKLGAKVYKGKTAAGDFGWFSVLADPTGAVFALWEAKQK